MAQVVSGISKTKILNQLDTYNHTTLQASMYKVAVKLSEIPASGITITIQQNGVTKASTSVPKAAQSHVELQVILNCAISDVIAVILASSVAGDQGGNSFKASLEIQPGLN